MWSAKHDPNVLNGRKWWITGILGERCTVMLVMGKSNPDAERHSQHSTILVPVDTPGFKIVRPLKAFGSYHSPGGEGELVFEEVRGQRWARQRPWLMQPLLKLAPLLARTQFVQWSWLRQQRPLRFGITQVKLYAGL